MASSSAQPASAIASATSASASGSPPPSSSASSSTPSKPPSPPATEAPSRFGLAIVVVAMGALSVGPVFSLVNDFVLNPPANASGSRIITDEQLGTIVNLLGSVVFMLIIVHHYLVAGSNGRSA